MDDGILTMQQVALSREQSDAFPTLGAADLALLERHGTRRSAETGEYLFRSGDATNELFVVLSGAIEIVVHANGSDHVVRRYQGGGFVGELNLVTRQRRFVSARVVERGEVLVVSHEVLQNLIAEQPRLSDMILRALVARRALLLRSAADSLQVVGSRYSPETRRIREYLTRSHIPHEWLDPESNAAVARLLQAVGVDPGDLPAVFGADIILRRVTAGSLAEYLGLTVASVPSRTVDLVIAGGGPAGLAAAVYGASEGLRTLLVEMVAIGGQAGSSSRIENYLGFPTGVAGAELAQRALVQAEKFGAYLTSPCTAATLREEHGHLVIRLSDGTDVVGRAVIAATGAAYRRLPIDRLAEFEGNGLYYAATEMEARQCAGAEVVVVGGGNSAGQAALFLAESGCAVVLVIRGHDLSKNMSRYLVDRIAAHARIDVRLNSQVTGIEGDRSVGGVQLTDPDGVTVIRCSGLFSLIGAEPSTEWLSGSAALDAYGFVLTDVSLTAQHLDDRWQVEDRRPLPFETSRPGLFAVGDVRSGSIKRVAAAVGEGSAAVRSVHQYLAFDH